jgi:hypothetical protein
MTFFRSGLLIGLTGASLLQAGAIEDTYREVFARSLYMLNDYTLRSGTYYFDGKNGNEDSKLSNMSIPGTYFFGDLFQGFRPFVEGAVGYSSYKEDNNRDIGGDIDFTSLYLKAGGGVSYTFASRLTLIAGASMLYLGSDGDFTPRTPIVNPRSKELFDGSQDNMIYDLYGSVAFRPQYEGYRPYLVATAHYLTFDYDASGIGNDEGWSGNLRAGFFTHQLTQFWGLPLEAELYVNGNALDHDLGELMGFDTALSGGTTLYWKVGSILPWQWLKELDITFTVQGTVTTTDVHGHKIGFGLSLTKF